MLYGHQEQFVEYLSGVDADGRIADYSYWTWSGSGNQYSSTTSKAHKWGDGAAGSGATISYGFDPASRWSAAEQNGFIASMHLWESVANIHFVASGNPVSADIMFARTSDGTAQTNSMVATTSIGSTMLGGVRRSTIGIDTSNGHFGPIGGALGIDGGHPWLVVLHEIGHALGLGHAGAYDGANARWSGATIDTLASSVMSYFDAYYSNTSIEWGGYTGHQNKPLTPMIYDIIAIQRLYGAPVDTPLRGGTVFGFNSNIQGDVRQFFDFTINTKPIVTLFSTGGNNTLDLSGFSTGSFATLRDGPGYSSSVAGLDDNLFIAAGTRIDTLKLGVGNDTAGGNDNGVVIMGGAGADMIGGGAGNDHLYGGGTLVTPGDGADTLRGGDGGDYLQGNAGNDSLDGGPGSDRIYGGAGDDVIEGDSGNDTINGNLGNDSIGGGDGNDLIRGGQGNDYLFGGSGDDIVMGDIGNDTVSGSWGIDVMIGGPGADVFDFGDPRDAEYATKFDRAYLFDSIADYQDGIDRIFIGGMGVPTEIIRIAVQSSDKDAAIAATSLLSGTGNPAAAFTKVVVAAVGSDTYMFYFGPAVGMNGVRIDNLSPDQLTTADFI